MKMNRWKIRTTYEGVSEDEILLPEGVEISSISGRYGNLNILTTDGDEVNLKGTLYVDWEVKHPVKITFEKEP